MAIASVIVKALSTVMTFPFLSTRSARRLMTSADGRDGVVCADAAVLAPARAVATPGLTAPAPLRKSRREIDRSAIQHPLMGAIALLCRHARLQRFRQGLRATASAFCAVLTRMIDHRHPAQHLTRSGEFHPRAARTAWTPGLGDRLCPARSAVDRGSVAPALGSEPAAG